MAYVRASSHCAVGFDQVSYLSGYCQGRAWRAESRTKTPLSTPEQKCIGSPEQKYINGADKKAPKLGALCLEIRLGADYAAAFPRRCGVSGACSD
jgi:hypothetical protein